VSLGIERGDVPFVITNFYYNLAGVNEIPFAPSFKRGKGASEERSGVRGVCNRGGRVREKKGVDLAHEKRSRKSCLCY